MLQWKLNLSYHQQREIEILSKGFVPANTRKNTVLCVCYVMAWLCVP